MEHSKHIHIHSQTQPQPYTHLRHIYRSKCQAGFSRVPPCCFCLRLPVHPLQTQSLGFGFSIFVTAFASTSVLFASVCLNSSSVSKIKFCLRMTYFHIMSFHILSLTCASFLMYYDLVWSTIKLHCQWQLRYFCIHKHEDTRVCVWNAQHNTLATKKRTERKTPAAEHNPSSVRHPDSGKHVGRKANISASPCVNSHFLLSQLQMPCPPTSAADSCVTRCVPTSWPGEGTGLTGLLF